MVLQFNQIPKKMQSQFLKLKRLKLKAFFILAFFNTIVIYLHGQDSEEYWDTYMATYENSPGSVVVRMDMINKAPVPGYNFALVTGVGFDGGLDGLPNQEDFDDLHAVSDDLEKTLASKDAILVGSFTYQSERLEYFYLKDTISIRSTLDAFYKQSYPEKKSYINIVSDATWNYYKEFLYPSPEVQEYMADLSVVRHLHEAGDSLIKPRRVDHWAYFSTKEEREQFATEAFKHGFQLEKSSINPSSSQQYEIIIWREDPVNIDHIYAVTSHLRRLALKFNGDYDGWETFILN